MNRYVGESRILLKAVAVVFLTEKARAKQPHRAACRRTRVRKQVGRVRSTSLGRRRLAGLLATYKF